MQKKHYLLISLVLIKIIGHFFLIDEAYELHRDEFLHLDQANHLAWGYQSVPPVTSWISLIIKWLGNGIFWVKFFPVLFGILTLYVVWKTIELLNGNLFAYLIGGIGITLSVLPRLNILYQPNSLDVLLWTSTFYFLLRFLKTNHTKWLYWTAVVFAFGILNKYNIIFLTLGLIPALLLTQHRKLLIQGRTYIAIGIVLLIISPNIYWQYQNHFPVFKHMKELSEKQLVNVNRWEFLQSQIFYFFGSLTLLLGALIGFIIYRPFQRYRFLLYNLIFTLALFILFKGKSYYAIGLYPIFLAFGAVYLEQLFRKRYTRVLQISTVAIQILFFIPMLNLSYPFRTPEYIIANQELYASRGLLKWEDGKNHSLPQDFADMLGWKELAAKVDSLYLQTPNEDPTIIITDNYGEAGAINYYSKLDLAAVSFNADYLGWFDLTKQYKNLIRVVYKSKVEKEITEIKDYFDSYVIFGEITNPYAREQGTTIIGFYGAKININKIIEEEIDMELAKFK